MDQESSSSSGQKQNDIDLIEVGITLLKNKHIDELPAPNRLQPWIYQPQEVVSICPIKALPQLSSIQGKTAPHSMSFNCCDEEFFQNLNTKRMTLFQHHDEYQQSCVYMKTELPLNRKHFASIIVPIQAPIEFKFGSSKLQTINNFISPNLQFDSCFESGNLFAAYRISERQYNLVLQNDINTKGHTQWFFFKVFGMCKNQTVRFNIINLVKEHSFFQDGLQPLVYSIEENKKYSNSWNNAGFYVQYTKNNFIRGQKQYHYTLSFTYNFEYESDQVFFSHSYPYTLSNLHEFLNNITNHSERQKYVTCKQLCKTISGNTCPVLTLTSDENKLDSQRQVFILMARQHPGETTGSFLMEGCIEYLTSNSFEATFLRNNFLFKFLPMMNPDGVVNGNYRCDLSGIDINRQWNYPSKKECPTVYKAKQMIKLLSQDRGIKMVLDFHSHSKKLGTFFYGNTDKVSLDETKAFPKISALNSKYISLTQSRFQVRACQNSTARVCLWKILNYCPNIFTVETSVQGYKQDGQKLINYTIKDLKNIGQDLCFSIFQMVYNQKSSQPIYKPLKEINIQNMSSKANLQDETQHKLKNLQNNTLKNLENQNKQVISKACIITSFNDQPIQNLSDTSMSDSNPLEDELTDRSVQLDIKKYSIFKQTRKKTIPSKIRKSQRLNSFLKQTQNNKTRIRCQSELQQKTNLEQHKIVTHQIVMPQLSQKPSISKTLYVKVLDTVQCYSKSTMTQTVDGKFTIATEEQIKDIPEMFQMKKMKSFSNNNKKFMVDNPLTNSKQTQTILTFFDRDDNEKKKPSFHSINIYKKFKHYTSNSIPPAINISFQHRQDNNVDEDQSKILNFSFQQQKTVDVRKIYQSRNIIKGSSIDQKLLVNKQQWMENLIIDNIIRRKNQPEVFSFNSLSQEHKRLQFIRFMNRTNTITKYQIHPLTRRQGKQSRKNSPSIDLIKLNPLALTKNMFQPLPYNIL